MKSNTSKTRQDPALDVDDSEMTETESEVAEEESDVTDSSAREEEEAKASQANSPVLIASAELDEAEDDHSDPEAESDETESPLSELPSIEDLVSRGDQGLLQGSAASNNSEIRDPVDDPQVEEINKLTVMAPDQVPVGSRGRGDKSAARRDVDSGHEHAPLFARGRRAADTMQSHYPEAPGASAESADEVTDLLEIIKRQWLMILLIIAGLMTAGIIVLSQIEPLYTARAEVVIDPQRVSLPTLESILPTGGTDDQSIETESQILVSGILLERVIEKLGLLDDPEFNSTIEDKESTTTAADSESTDPDGRALAVTRMALLNSLDVVRVADSRVISIRVTSKFAEKSALVANTIVQEFLQAKSDAKTSASSETAAWLDNRISELQGVIRESEMAAERLRSDAQILEAGGTTLLSQQMANLNNQIISAKSASAAARVELSQVLELVESTDGDSILASGGVLNSPIIQELRTQQVALEREIAELSSELGPAHPRMVQLNADASDLNSQILIEVEKVVQGLRNSVQVAEARETELQRQAAILRTRLSATKDDEIQLRAMEREIDANRSLFETLLAQRKELGSPDQIQGGQSGARVISFATPPISPSFPQFGISMAAIFFVAVLLSLAVSFIREIRRRGLTTLEQLEGMSRVDALGVIPAVKSRSQRRAILDLLSSRPNSPFAQALKTVNWQLKEQAGSERNVIVATSSVPDEGKTTLCLGLAMVRAQKGNRVVVVDADIRNPAVHQRMLVSQEPGLRDVLEGACSIEDALFFDEASSLYILPAGKNSHDALDVLESSELSSLLEQLGDEYDDVFVDSPPVSVGPDATVLSKAADATVFAVRWSKTPRPSVEFALRKLERHGGDIVGTLLTMVDLSQASSGYFGYYGYYGDKTA